MLLLKDILKKREIKIITYKRNCKKRLRSKIDDDKIKLDLARDIKERSEM
jgi:hypothetical protein